MTNWITATFPPVMISTTDYSGEELHEGERVTPPQRCIWRKRGHVLIKSGCPIIRPHPHCACNSGMTTPRTSAGTPCPGTCASFEPKLPHPEIGCLPWSPTAPEKQRRRQHEASGCVYVPHGTQCEPRGKHSRCASHPHRGQPTVTHLASAFFKSPRPA